MTIFLELQNRIAVLAEHPAGQGDPTNGQIYELSKLWKQIADPYFDENVALDGWKADWVRAAKHTFIESCCHRAFPGVQLEKSTDVPRDIYGEIVTFVSEHPMAVLAWIILHEREIAERADLLCIAGFNQYVNREPVGVAEHLPNVQGETPIPPRARKKQTGPEAAAELEL